MEWEGVRTSFEKPNLKSIWSCHDLRHSTVACVDTMCPSTHIQKHKSCSNKWHQYSSIIFFQKYMAIFMLYQIFKKLCENIVTCLDLVKYLPTTFWLCCNMLCVCGTRSWQYLTAACCREWECTCTYTQCVKTSAYLIFKSNISGIWKAWKFLNEQQIILLRAIWKFC